MMINDELRQPMARANSSPATMLRSRRWSQAAHTKNAIAQMKSAVDVAGDQRDGRGEEGQRDEVAVGPAELADQPGDPDHRDGGAGPWPG